MPAGPLMISIEGQQLSAEEKEMLALPAVGGVILFAENYQDKAQLAALIQSIKAANTDCIIGIDQEGGRVQRLKRGFTSIPPMAAFGHLYDTESERALALVYDSGSLIAEELGEMQIDLGFCPVLDLNIGVSSVIGDRAFHASAEVVAKLSEAFIKGLHNGGLLSVGKHYPGHGSVQADTHHQKVVDTRSLEEIRQQDLFPYQYLIQRNLLDAVMTAHVVYTAVDDKPATVSNQWLNDILSGELNFDGVVFSDDLSMQGMRSTLENRNIADILDVCHVLIICHDQALIRRAVDELSVDNMQLKIENCRRELTERWENRLGLLAKRVRVPTNPGKVRVALRELNEQFNG